MFHPQAFERFLLVQNIGWPRLGGGNLDLSDETFRERTRAYPELRPLRELRTTLSVFDPKSLTIGRDHRNRVPLRPFSSRTGRSQPGAKASLFGTAAWVRHLIKPKPGMSLALIDWEQQEFGIAAALSGDYLMQESYRSGDAYLGFSAAAGADLSGGTAEVNEALRQQFKACALGVQYGMGANTLAVQLGLSEGEAATLIQKHKSAFPRFWKWCNGIENYALLHGRLQSVFGWQVLTPPPVNSRFLRNFPMQANGAEMMRLAACLITEADILVCATLHDAFLIEAQGKSAVPSQRSRGLWQKRAASFWKGLRCDPLSRSSAIQGVTPIGAAKAPGVQSKER